MQELVMYQERPITLDVFNAKSGALRGKDSLHVGLTRENLP